MLNQRQKDDLRAALLEFYALRPRHAYTALQVAGLLNRAKLVDFTPAPDQIEDANALLLGAGLVDRIYEAVGSTPLYRATTAGILQYERGASA
jgi:hypothetical protein